MSATDELRRMLDERGAEWKAWDGGVHPITVWHDETYLYEFVEYRLVNDAKQVSDCPSDNDGHCELTIKVYNCTPEQAMASTLGSCNCSNSERTETCHDLAETPSYRDKTEFKCSECGYEYSAVGGFGCDYGDEPDFNFCPNCGRRIEVDDG